MTINVPLPGFGETRQAGRFIRVARENFAQWAVVFDLVPQPRRLAFDALNFPAVLREAAVEAFADRGEVEFMSWRRTGRRLETFD